MKDVDWIPALVVVAVGLLAGAAYAWRARRAGLAPAAVAESPSPSLVARDLRGKLDALLQQLRELEFTAVKRSPEQLAAERRALELDAARTLRELDGLGPALAREAPAVARAPAGVEARPPANAGALRGFLWGTGTVASLGLLLFLVSRSAEERREGATVTGNTPIEGQGEREAADAELAGLRAAVERSPQDLEARLDLARAYLARQDMMGVFQETKFVLERSPGEPRALSYQALVRLAMGQPDVALQMLQQALQAQPDFVEGYVHLAIVYSRMGRAKDAERTMEGAIRRFPGEAGTLRELADAIRRAAPDETAMAAAEADPHASVPPPAGVGSSMPPAPRRPPASSLGVSGTVDLDPALKGQVRAGGVLFVMARPEGFGAGPPLAAKRIPVVSLPVAFQLSSADSMMGDALPDKILLEARLDADGDPTTRDPSDPYASLDGVALGSKQVSLVLRRRTP